MDATKRKTSITAHCLVKNEENFIWYSIMSVVDCVDKILVWDTGSTDRTIEIIDEIRTRYPKKVDFVEVGDVDPNKYSEIRQKMVSETKNGWIFVLDGDEIWWNNSIEIVTVFLKENAKKYESIVVPTMNLVGDMFHYQEQSGGRYKFGKLKGHYALRFINRDISGLHISDSYGKEGFFDGNNVSIQNRDETRIKFINAPYIHTTHLVRSPKDKEVMQRIKKTKYELGIEFPKDFYYPESFFKEKPEIVKNVWENANSGFKFRAFFETPLRKIKRRI